MIRLPRRSTQIQVDFSPSARVSAGNLRLDFSAQQSALARVSQAIGQGSRYREVDVSSGVQAFARVAGFAGDRLQQLLARNQEITDRRKIYENETRLRVAQEEIAQAMQQEKDPNRWGEIFDEQFPRYLQQLDLEGMSPEAQEAVRGYAQRVQALGSVKARTDGMRRNEELLIQDREAAVLNSARMGDPQAVGQGLAEWAEITGASPDVVANKAYELGKITEAAIDDEISNTIKFLREQGKHDDVAPYLTSHRYFSNPNDPKAQDKLARILSAEALNTRDAKTKITIAQNPAKWLAEELPKIKDTDPVFATDMAKHAVSEVKFQSASALDKVATDLATPGTSKMAVIMKATRGEYPGLTPAMRQKVIDELRQPTPTNSDQDFISLMHSITNFKPTGKGEEADKLELANLRNQAEIFFTGSRKDELLATITEKRAELNNEREENRFSPQITAAMKNGLLGNYMRPYEEVANDPTRLSPLDRTRAGAGLIEDEDLVQDQVVYQRAASLLEELNKDVRNMKRTGATDEAITKYLNNRLRAINVVNGVAVPNSGVFYVPGGADPSLLPPIEPMSPNPPLPPVTPAELEEAQKILKSL